VGAEPKNNAAKRLVSESWSVRRAKGSVWGKEKRWEKEKQGRHKGLNSTFKRYTACRSPTGKKEKKMVWTEQGNGAARRPVEETVSSNQFKEKPGRVGEKSFKTTSPRRGS